MSGCKCQGCGARYRVDVLVRDELWEEIRPVGSTPGGGLLCGACIIRRLEHRGEFDCYALDDSERAIRAICGEATPSTSESGR